MSRGQTLLLLPCDDNKLHKQKLAISSTPNSAKLDIGDGIFIFLSLYGSKSNGCPRHMCVHIVDI